MIEVFRATSEEIESINIDGFFNTATLGKDKHGIHYYPCDEFCERNPDLTEEQKAIFESLEKVDFDSIEREEIE
jgi:hypothetical protein